MPRSGQPLGDDRDQRLRRKPDAGVLHGGRISFQQIKDAANRAVIAEFGPGEWIASAKYPTVYLSKVAVAQKPKDLAIAPRCIPKKVNDYITGGQVWGHDKTFRPFASPGKSVGTPRRRNAPQVHSPPGTFDALISPTDPPAEPSMLRSVPGDDALGASSQARPPGQARSVRMRISTPVTRGELREEIERLEIRLDQKLAQLATKADLEIWVKPCSSVCGPSSRTSCRRSRKRSRRRSRP
jgi:hypothetical protein